jgi:hypothetical protein
MQGNWKDTVYDQAVMPPAGTWEAIALALDAAEKEPAWQDKVYHATATPPADSWQQIAAALDKGAAANWQNKIYHYETMPPTGVWEAVAVQLQAPAVVRRINWLRMAAAAAIVLTIAGTAVWALSDRGEGSGPQTVATNTEKQAASPGQSLAVAPSPVAAPAAPVATPPVAAPANKKAASITDIRQPAGPTEYASNIEQSFLPADAVFTNTRKLPNEQGAVTVDINAMETPNSQYISISGPDGQTMRVSAKFANLLGYLNEGSEKEERLDRIIKESAFWKATFRQWREKMIQANATPSLGNFMDVVELAKALQ